MQDSLIEVVKVIWWIVAGTSGIAVFVILGSIINGVLRGIRK